MSGALSALPQARAVPVAIVNLPCFFHVYKIDYRHLWCCYYPYFTIKKEEKNWILKKHNEDKSYTIPITKDRQSVLDVLKMIGIEDRIFKLKLIQDNKVIKSKIFYNLNSLYDNIVFSESCLSGVYYQQI